jgi:adenylate cyclase
MATFAFIVGTLGAQGKLKNATLTDEIFPRVRAFQGFFTDIKFKLRGAEPPKNKIVIVEIDDHSIEDPELGRWPWRRDKMAKLINNIFEAGAKVVALDIVFSEPDIRIPDGLRSLLQDENALWNGTPMSAFIDQFETDPELVRVVEQYRDRLIMGWTPNRLCMPRYSASSESACFTQNSLTRPILRHAATLPFVDETASFLTPPSYTKFAFRPDQVTGFSEANRKNISLNEIQTGVFLYDSFAEPASHAATFFVTPDRDGYVRRTQLLFGSEDGFHSSLALKMAEVGLADPVQITFSDEGTLEKIAFSKSGRELATTAAGALEINFRGPAYTYEYISAREVVLDVDANNNPITMGKRSDGRNIASVPRETILKDLKDAYVLIGVTALGVWDMRAFPFESNAPGVEGHAFILDNILSGDFLDSGRSFNFLLFLFLSVGAIVFTIFVERLAATPALLLFLAVFFGVGIADLKLLFENQINWNTGLIYVEFGLIFFCTLFIKYVSEERNKREIRAAFSKYVAPAVVDSILADPTKLTLGGHKKDLTILFSDIRGFTTFSEKMDAKELAAFLNEYLGTMTDIVFDTGGTLDKYIGDAVMAFWGAPVDQPQHAANALGAAVKMQKSLAERRPYFKEKYGVDVHIGIGINSGNVNVGNMGSEKIFEFTVIGDHVNLASRLEGLTKPYHAGILTTRFTFDMIESTQGEKPSHRTLDFVKVKGKKQAVELIEIFEGPRSAKGCALFENARVLYTQQKWDEAIETFRQAIAEFKATDSVEEDGPSLMYIERCEEFKKQPPEKDWDGSWEMHSK